jgi:hypothetical protein
VKLFGRWRFYIPLHSSTFTPSRHPFAYNIVTLVVFGQRLTINSFGENAKDRNCLHDCAFVTSTPSRWGRCLGRCMCLTFLRLLAGLFSPRIAMLHAYKVLNRSKRFARFNVDARSCSRGHSQRSCTLSLARVRPRRASTEAGERDQAIRRESKGHQRGGEGSMSGRFGGICWWCRPNARRSVGVVAAEVKYAPQSQKLTILTFSIF